MTHRYLIALGSNMPHHRHGRPEGVLAAALAAMGQAGGMELLARSAILRNPPIGPSRRRFANAVALVRAACEPPALLARLQEIERRFGRKARGRGRGQRWAARVLDLDIVLWSGGMFVELELVVPHPRFRERGFVLRPATAIAGDWRDPVSGLTVRQLSARLTRSRSAPN